MEGITDEQLEKAAIEYATGMMGIGEYSEKWHSGDKSLFQNLKRAVMYGQNRIIQEYILSHSVDKEPNVIDSLKENEYLDLTELDESVKTDFIKEVASACSKDLLKTFLGCGLKTHIEQMIINDKTGEEYILSFQTSEVFKKRFNVDSIDRVREAQESDAVAFADWRDMVRHGNYKNLPQYFNFEGDGSGQRVSLKSTDELYQEYINQLK